MYASAYVYYIKDHIIGFMNIRYSYGYEATFYGTRRPTGPRPTCHTNLMT